MMSAEERRQAFEAGQALIATSLNTLYDLAGDGARPKTEEELTVMQVMIANAQANAAVAEFLYAMFDDQVTL